MFAAVLFDSPPATSTLLAVVGGLVASLAIGATGLRRGAGPNEVDLLALGLRSDCSARARR